MTAEALRTLQQAWFDDCRDLTAAPLGDGHIHDTFLICQTLQPRYVLQRLNRRVFAQPERLAGNLDRVLAHFADRPLRLPELVATRATRNWHVDDAGDWWRLWRYRQHTRTLNAPVSETETRAAAQAFGCFQQQMKDFDPPALQSTIPGFLELDIYLQALDRVRHQPTDSAVNPVEQQFIEDHRPLAARFPNRHEYIHGDCKLDNLLFVQDAAVVDCVLDLDTVMPGHWAWDFGDLVRSLITLQQMASTDVVPRSEQPPLSPGLFAAAVQGFIEGKEENLALEDLLAAPCYVSYMLGIRFLTDHLAGDVYFKVAASGENLQRARQQFSIVAALEAHSDLLRVHLQSLPGVIG